MADHLILLDDPSRAADEVERLRNLLADAERAALQLAADAHHEGWSRGVRDAVAVHRPDEDVDQSVAAVEQSGLEENPYLARLDLPEVDDRPEMEGR